MYIIKLNGKRFGKKEFTDYEEARSYVRKQIRKKAKVAEWDISYKLYHNPAISLYGFEVEWRPVALHWNEVLAPVF